MSLRALLHTSTKILLNRYFVTNKNNTFSLSTSVHRKYSREMAERASGKYLQEILTKLQDFAPLNLAESWDNVGLLVNPMENIPIQNILLTNDLTEDVVAEAIKLQTGLIISYHPNIFQGLKSVTSQTWKERIVVQCIKNNIAVYSPHTSWDSIKGGVNDWLVDSFPASYETVKPIKENPINEKFGPGRIFSLNSPITVREAVERVKKQTGLDYVRLALARNKSDSSAISTVALCAGSGSSVLNGIEADLYLTGEMLHHDILDATQRGVHVILCNHSDSERGFLKDFKNLLTAFLDNDVNVFISEMDKDPLRTV